MCASYGIKAIGDMHKGFIHSPYDFVDIKAIGWFMNLGACFSFYAKDKLYRDKVIKFPWCSKLVCL